MASPLWKVSSTRRIVCCVTAALYLGLLVPIQLSAATPDTTRKVVLEKAGAGYRWKVVEAPIPPVGDRQVLVHVHALSLNRGDLSRLESEPDERPDKVGQVVGTDAAGEVVAVGKLVKDFHKGERVTSTYFKNWTDGPFSSARIPHVAGWTAEGVLADYIALDSTDVVPIPDWLSYEEASTLPTAAVTAWNAVAGHRAVHSGDVVLVQGTGGVSTFALQFAAALGARVIVTSSSDEKLLRAKALGAHDGINYKSEPDWSARVLQLTQGHGADLVVDVGGKETLGQSVKALADGGTVAIVGGLTGYDGSISSLGLLMKDADAASVFVGSNADYLRMTAFMTKHRLHPVIERVFPLERSAEALQALASGHFVGKIVLKL
jgi:NADPH:quinone reductase-like Zn-dependent oxidoreductase